MSNTTITVNCSTCGDDTEVEACELCHGEQADETGADCELCDGVGTTEYVDEVVCYSCGYREQLITTRLWYDI